jgi:hypothetical protein
MASVALLLTLTTVRAEDIDERSVIADLRSRGLQEVATVRSKLGRLETLVDGKGHEDFKNFESLESSHSKEGREYSAEGENSELARRTFEESPRPGEKFRKC